MPFPLCLPLSPRNLLPICPHHSLKLLMHGIGPFIIFIPLLGMVPAQKGPQGSYVGLPRSRSRGKGP